ncbi:hypothetical protein COB55_00460 [Candidatus Wolfebacteria bacterium]|nr:MAG: hypothetical protein COB55_00460 [Candidatus Wolfebacteria bacterium]
MDIMLRSALREHHGLRNQLDKNLIGNHGDEWEKEFKKFLRKEPCWNDVQAGGSQAKLAHEFRREFLKNGGEIVKMCLSWELFYCEEFGENQDFSQLKIPEKQKGFNRLIVVAKGMTMNLTYYACTRKFLCERYEKDLDAIVIENDSVSKESYAIWVRDCVEADEGLKNLSAGDLLKRGIKGITLLERMLLELKYFRETGKHLDIENITLCSGSRFPDDRVPGASWRDGGFGVCWFCSADRFSRLRSRAVVS